MIVFDNIYKANIGYTDYDIINQHISPLVTIKRLVGQELVDLVTFSYKDVDSLLSYSYTRNIDDIKGKFTIRFKDVNINTNLSKIQTRNATDYKIVGSIYDNLLPFDIVYIKKDSEQVSYDYIGLIHTKQISASIGSDGKVKKEVSISGSSILSLFNDFFINLSVIGTSATNTTAANFNLKNNFFNVNNDNGMITMVPQRMDLVITSIWDDFKNYAEKLAGVSNINLITLINKLNIKIDCQQIDCKYAISTNLYNDGEIRFIQMIKALFPDGAYEIYEEKSKLRIRETPFRNKDWIALNDEHCYKINPARLLEYDFTQSDNEVYSVFMADVEGLKEIDTSYNHARRAADSKGFINVETNDENLKTYGYRLCNVSFLGYAQNPGLEDKEQIFDHLNKDLKEMYENVHKMLNGRIKVVEGDKNPTIGEKINFSIKKQDTLETTSFYINSETHTWSYGSTATIDYSISRGAIYDPVSGEFKSTPNGFTTALESEILKG